ncbi:hypothetical protein M758_8G001700 [Ceratodon purpureus]|uniref:Uncharacterized protein n=1 Tax=Ceratodon purpureus TaxID=3225 RepID=A0A8T0GVL5_CERPU|nr:hypothetical protein KC19_8G002800 [Ceratodon purpureus]KAG0607078.1 hypothetical protein M758_8G001700 [Ceratodon purpureus]
MANSFEIIREDDQTSLGKYKATPEGKLVSEVLGVIFKQYGLDGILLEDDSTHLTDSDRLTAGQIYKFLPSTNVPPPGTSKPYKPQKLIGTSVEGMNARVHMYYTMREQTAEAICRLVDARGAVLIRAPPGSGKTSLLQLVGRVVTPDMFKDVYYISLADLGEKTFEELWNKTHPGVDIDEIRSPTKNSKNPESSSERPTLLLVDEGQAAFAKDLSLWPTLKVVAGGLKEHLRIIVVSAWGSNNVVEAGHLSSTPVEFTADNTISLWPTDSCSVALQLTEGEATELWAEWCHKGLADKLASADHLRDYIFHLTGKQPGLMTKVLDWLLEKGLRNVPACHMEEKARCWLLSSAFLDSLSSLRSLRTLSSALGDGKPDSGSMRSLVRKLLAEEYVHPGLLNDSDKKAAGLAVKWGQIVEDKELGFSIPSQLHRQFLFREVYCTNDLTSATILKEGLVAFVRRVIERYDPSRLHLSLSRSAANDRIYERQYQDEFYRAVCTVIPKTEVISPEVGRLFGAEGYLDYLLSPCGWGFELLRDGTNMKEHIERFEPDGIYSKLLEDKVVKDYVILDLRMKPFSQPIQSSHAVHVVFSDDFNMATLHTLGSEPEVLYVRGQSLDKAGREKAIEYRSKVTGDHLPRPA